MKRTRLPMQPQPGLADRVRFLRVQLGKPRWMVAADAHVSDGWLSWLESGRIKHPSPVKLRQLAAALGTSDADLFEAAGYAELNMEITEPMRDMIRLMAELPERRQQHILSIVRMWLEEDELPRHPDKPKWTS